MKNSAALRARLLLLLATTALTAAPAFAADILVTNASGLAAAIGSAGAGDRILLQNNINLGSTLLGPVSANITIDGQGHTLSAQGNNRILFLDSSATIQNITLDGGKATGGNGGGGAQPGGGGMGAGGAIFVNSGTATVSNVSFTNNSATGGNGGALYFAGGTSGGGGGGGLGGSGGDRGQDSGGGGGGYSGGGGGGGGLGGGLSVSAGAGGAGPGGAGGTGGDGLDGSAGSNGGAGGTANTAYGYLTGGGGGGGGVNGGTGGNGSTSNVNGGGGGGGSGYGGSGGNGGTQPGSANGTNGGVGGGGGGAAADATFAGNGGVFGGGGGGSNFSTAGNGGFGGGGGGSGAAASVAGSGGFGGGAGAASNSSALGVAGIGGGDASVSNAGGGAGFGGAIFVRDGANLTIGDGSFSGGGVTAGSASFGTGKGATAGTGLFLMNGTTTTFNPTGTLTINDTIADDSLASLASGQGFTAGSGAGAAITISGGTVMLNGANSYSGGTVISGGILNISSDAALGASGGSLSLSGGTLQFGASFDLSGTRAISVNNGTFDTNGFDSTISQAISGTGLTKAGAGTLTLSGLNTYGGGTNIDGGTLQMGVGNALSASTAVTVASGATFDLNGFSQTVGSLAGGGTVLLGGSNLTFGGDNASTIFSGTMTSTGATSTLTKSGAGTFTVNGSIDLGVAGGANTQMNLTSGGLVVGSTGSLTLDFIQSFGTIQNSGTITSFVQTFSTLTNDGEIVGGTNSFSSLTNTGTMGFLNNFGIGTNSGTTGSVSNYSSFTSTGVINGNFTNYGTAFLEGEVNGSIVNLSGATTTLTGTVTGLAGYYGYASAILDLAGFNTTLGSIASDSEIKLGGATLTVNGGDLYVFNGVISGAGDLVKDGTGVMELNGTNTFTGGITVAGGVLRLGSNGAAGTGAITTTGSIIDYVNGVDIANDLIISSDTTQLNVSGTGTATQSGFILEDSSPRPLEKTGTGTLIVASANNSGTTTITAGTWKAANALAFSVNSDHVIASDAVLDMNGNDQIVRSLAGAGTVTSSAAGNITLAVGNFGIGNIGTIFSGVIEDGSATVNLMVDGASGTFVLTGANTYTGDTIICDCSALQIGNGGATGSITSNVVNNGLLIFNRSDDYDFTYTISDGFGSPGNVSQIGAGVLTLSGVNSYSGETTVTASTLEIGNASAIGASTLVLDGGTVRPGSSGIDLANDVAVNAAGGTISVSDGQDFTLSGTISDGSGAGVLTKTGAGTLILSGSSSYSGGTVVNGGVLAISDDSNLGATTGALTLDGGTLRADGIGLTLDGARDINLGSNGGTINVNGNGIQVDGNIHGAGHLTINGGGFTAGGGFLGGGLTSVAFLGGFNDHTGGTTIDDTIVIVPDSLALGDAAGAITLQNTGTVAFFGPATLESTRTITLGTGGGGIIGFDSLQVDSKITGSGSLTMIGLADITLAGTNDYTGGTVLLGGGAGEFFISDDRNLGAASGALEMNGAILGFDANVTMAQRAVTLSGLGGVFDTDTHTVTILRPVSGTGDLVQLGSGTLILAGDNTHTGDTFVDGGTLQLGNGGASGSLAADPGDMIFNGGTLVFNSSGTHTVSQDITNFFDDGVVRQLGSGTTILTGTNDYAGGTMLDGGTLQVASDANLGDAAGRLIFNGGALRLGAAFDPAATRDITLQAGGGTLDTNGFNATLVQAITGAGGFTKSGAGTLTLASANSFAGGLTINAGTLALTGAGNIATAPLIANGIFDFSAMSGSGVTVTTLNGSGTVATGSKSLTILNGGAFTGTGTGTGSFILGGGIFSVNGIISNGITLNSGATLKGRGTVGGIVSGSGGTVAPGNSIGTLNVAGNVGFATGSVYQVEVDNTGASDRIAATGTATLSGGTVDVQAAAGTYGYETNYTILTATGGVTGQFAGATSNLLFLGPSLSYGANAVTLTLKQVRTLQSVAQTPNQIAAATAMQAGGLGGGALFLSAFNVTSAADAQGAFDAASGEIHATLLASQQEAASTTRRVVLERMRAGVANEAGWSVWGSISGNWGDMDSDGNAAAAKRTGVSLTAGADTRLDDNWRGGFEGGYSSSKLTVAARNSMADIQSGHIGAYAYGSYDAIKLRLGGTYGFGTADTQRVVIFTGFNDLATASQDAGTVNLFGEAGYTFSFDGYSIEPFAGLSWTQVKAGSFRESGGSAALAGASRLLSDGTATLGAAFTATPYSFAGVSLAPTLRVGWQHAFSNDLASRSLSFISTGQGFTVLGTPLDADRAVIDAGATLSLGSSMNLFLGYTGTLSSRVRDNGVRITGEVRL